MEKLTPFATSTTASTPGRGSASFGDSVEHEATLFVGIFVEPPNGIHAKVREVMTKLLDLLLAQNIR